MGNNRDQDSTSPIEEGSTEFSNLSDSISEYEPVSVPSEINRINRLQNLFRIDNNRNPRNEDIMSDSSATSSPPPPPPPPPPIRPHQNPCPNGSNNISYDNIAAYAQSIVGIIRSTLAGIPNPQGVDEMTILMEYSIIPKESLVTGELVIIHSTMILKNIWVILKQTLRNVPEHLKIVIL